MYVEIAKEIIELYEGGKDEIFVLENIDEFLFYVAALRIVEKDTVNLN